MIVSAKFIYNKYLKLPLYYVHRCFTMLIFVASIKNSKNISWGKINFRCFEIFFEYNN